MESHVFNPKHKQTGLRLAGLAFASLAALMAANDLTDGKPPEGTVGGVAPRRRANYGDRFAATSKSLSTTPRAESCERQCQAGKRGARRQQESSLCSRRKQSTTPTCTTTPSCP